MIDIHLSNKTAPAADTLALFAFEGPTLAGGPLGAAQGKALLELARQDGFTGKKGEVYLARLPETPARKLALIGLGKKAKADLEAVRQGAAAAVRRCLKHHKDLRFALPALSGAKADAVAAAVAEGARLATYRFDRHRTVEEKDKPDLHRVEIAADGLAPAAARKALEKAKALTDAIAFVRDWVNEPPSHKAPELLGNEAKKFAGGRLTVEVLDRAALVKQGFGGVLGVARGSSIPPVFVHMHYKGPGAKKSIALVGKGITFDSGGLSLKPPQSMETMKDDMAGAATVLAVLSALPKLGVRADVHGFAPITYNMPGPDATKPGDVLKALNGKTIEVLNTDAEGRLVLADALAYASRLKPDVIIDLATLTGAAVIALGSACTAAMTNDKRALERLLAVSKKTGEMIWELPLIEEYKEGLKSKVADLQNISSARGEAGTIIGGLFLQEFVDGAAWIHLDIATTAFSTKDTALCPAGGTGVMVRTLLEYLAGL